MEDDVWGNPTVHKPRWLKRRRARRKGRAYPAEPPRAPGPVPGAKAIVKNRRQKHAWAHGPSGADRQRNTGQVALGAPG